MTKVLIQILREVVSERTKQPIEVWHMYFFSVPKIVWLRKKHLQLSKQMESIFFVLLLYVERSHASTLICMFYRVINIISIIFKLSLLWQYFSSNFITWKLLRSQCVWMAHCEICIKAWTLFQAAGVFTSKAFTSVVEQIVLKWASQDLTLPPFLHSWTEKETWSQARKCTEVD